jgi:hypothetical protein
LGSGWVAHSSVSQETHLLNDEAAALLDALSEVEAKTEDEVARGLATEVGLDVSELVLTLSPVWDGLVGAGLVLRRKP